MKVIVLIVLAIAILVIGPLLLIWSLNTLFPILNIAYGLDTWAATALLSGALKSTVSVKK